MNKEYKNHVLSLIDALSYQEQCDEDGVMVMVSHQAVDEAMFYLGDLLRLLEGCMGGD